MSSASSDDGDDLAPDERAHAVRSRTRSPNPHSVAYQAVVFAQVDFRAARRWRWELAGVSGVESKTKAKDCEVFAQSSIQYMVCQCLAAL